MATFSQVKLLLLAEVTAIALSQGALLPEGAAAIRAVADWLRSRT